MPTTMNSNDKPYREDSLYTKNDMRQVMVRSFHQDCCWNYERQQNVAFCYMMIPILKRLYKGDKKALSDGLKRHLEFMAVTPHYNTLLIGICAAMEEENRKLTEFDPSLISSVKVSLMGPMAGIGDAFFWGTWLTIATGIGVSFAQRGTILGPLLFLLVFNLPHLIAKFSCLGIGYKNGVKFFANMSNSNIIARVTKSASVLGLMVVGAMAASMIAVTIPLEVGVEGAMSSVQSYIDQIMPGFLPLVVFGLMYWLLGKKVKTTTILIILITISCIGAFFGVLG